MIGLLQLAARVLGMLAALAAWALILGLACIVKANAESVTQCLIYDLGCAHTLSRPQTPFTE